MTVIDGLNVIIELVKGNIAADEAGEQLIDLVPTFEQRLVFIGLMLALILLVNGISMLIKLFRKRKKQKQATKSDGVFDLIKGKGDGGSKNSSKKPRNNQKRKNLLLRFENVLLKIPIFKNVLIFIDKNLLSRVRNVSLWRKNQKNTKQSKIDSVQKVADESGSKGNERQKRKRFVFRIFVFLKKRVLMIFNILVVILILGVVGATCFARPLLIKTDPVEKSRFISAEERITLEFDIPVDQDSLEFNVSPEVKGEWKFKPIISWLPYSREAVFYPEESFFPDKEVIIYAVGLRSPFLGGKKHEQSIEFKSPKIPEIAEFKPDKNAENIPVDEKIIIDCDSNLGEFVDMQFAIKPSVEFSAKRVKNRQEIEFKEELSQDQKYSVEVYRTPRSYNVKTNEDIERGETEKIWTSSFATVTTPLVESYKPKGDSVHADKDVEIVFDQPMNADSVEENFSITPEVEGEFDWKDDKTLLFKPKNDLAKETHYKVLVKKGVLSKYSGRTKQDIEIKFTTIGKVKVVSTSPISGSSGLNPSNTNIVIGFNQEVDHASAQSKFAISPAVSGNFGWEGNKMIFYTAGKLSYSTTYTVSVSSGVKTVYGLDSDKAYSFRFTTKPNVVLLNIPWYKQQGGFTCNLAAARMALAYRGVHVSESQIKSAIGVGGDPNSNWVSGYGVHWGPIANYIGRYRSVSVKTGWNTAALAREVEKGNPVIVWWYNRYSQPPGAFTLDSGATGYKGMHSEVVRGFTGDSSNPTVLYTNDPWRGRLTYSRSLFDSTWGYLGYAAVVVY